MTGAPEAWTLTTEDLVTALTRCHDGEHPGIVLLEIMANGVIICPACSAEPGDRHEPGCRMPLCTLTGLPVIVCECERGCEPGEWAGCHPWDDSCHALGLVDGDGSPDPFGLHDLITAQEVEWVDGTWQRV